MKCIEVDQSGAPISGNHMKGEATLLTLPDPERNLAESDASKYNAIGILGLDSNDSDTVLCLGGGASPKCPAGAEYQGCPDLVLLSHFAEGTTNPLIEEFGDGPSTVNTEITVVPCTQNFETQEPATTTIQFRIYNEYEEQFSTSTSVQCWGNWSLEDVNSVFTEGTLGTRFIQTYLRPAISPGAPSSFVAVQEEFHQAGTQPVRRVAFNTHVQGERDATGTDFITIPEGP